MKQVGVYDAKTQLPKLLEEVERGETFVITRHGHPVARLVPMETPRMSMDEVIAGFRELRKGKTVSASEIREFIQEGRRF